MKKILFAILTVSIAFLASCNKKNEPENSDAPQNDEASGTIKDICGNTYNYVKIGEQYWMAENMRCNKYDTQSERKGETLSTSRIETYYAPYYTNASDKSKWRSTEYSGKLSDEQIAKLGYHYSWAAAVGLSTAEAAKELTSSFSGNRQGICPNGWHVPTNSEWDALGTALGGKHDGDFPDVGKKLKTTSGWYENGNGTDDHSFAALPAGLAGVGSVYYVGCFAIFWTATNSLHTAYGRYLGYKYDSLDGYGNRKSYAHSVRCVRN